MTAVRLLRAIVFIIRPFLLGAVQRLTSACSLVSGMAATCVTTNTKQKPCQTEETQLAQQVIATENYAANVFVNFFDSGRQEIAMHG